MIGRVRRLALGVVGLCVVAMTGAACAPAPTGVPDGVGDDAAVVTPDWFAGGTYPLDVALPSQTVTHTFPLFGGPATCTSTITTPSVELPGATVSLDPVSIDAFAATVTIPNARVDLPRAAISLGSLTLRCDGQYVGSIGVQVHLTGAASVGTARLDLASSTVSLTDPTVHISDASLRFTGDAAALGPVALDPIELRLPSVDVVL